MSSVLFQKLFVFLARSGLLFSLNSAMSLNIPIFILADVNYNMLWPKEKEAEALHDFCDSFNVTQVINKPKK